MAIGDFLGNLFRGVERQAVAKQASESAAKAVSETAGKDVANEATVSALRVSADSDVSKIIDSYQRSGQLLSSNGAKLDSVNALLDKELFGEHRWQITSQAQPLPVPGTAYEQDGRRVLIYSEPQYYRGTPAQYAQDGRRWEIFPDVQPGNLSPAQTVSALTSGQSVVVHDQVSHVSQPVASLDGLLALAKSLLGRQ